MTIPARRILQLLHTYAPVIGANGNAAPFVSLSKEEGELKQAARRSQGGCDGDAAEEETRRRWTKTTETALSQRGSPERLPRQ